MIQYKRTLFAFIMACVMLAGGCGSGGAKAVDIAGIEDYRDIPGVSEEEIAAIEAVKAGRSFLTLGDNREIEMLSRDALNTVGFPERIGELFTGLFGISFVHGYYPWDELRAGLDEWSLDFTITLIPTSKRMETYYMSKSLAERGVTLYTADGGAAVNENGGVDGLRLGFLADNVIEESIRALYPEQRYTTVTARNTEHIVELLQAGEIDAFATRCLERWSVEGDISGESYFPLVYAPVSLSTAQGELQAFITVFDKYLEAGGGAVIEGLYEASTLERAREQFNNALSTEERIYLRDLITMGGKVTVAYEGMNYPLAFYNSVDGSFQGMAPDILGMIGRLTDIEFVEYPQKDLDAGEVYGLLASGGVSMSVVLDSDFPSGGVTYAQYALDAPRYALLSKTGSQDLVTYKVNSSLVGVVEGTPYERTLDRLFPELSQKKVYKTLDAALNALKQGYINLLMASEYTLLYHANYREELGVKVNVVLDVPLYARFCFSINEEPLRALINKAMSYVDTEAAVSGWKQRVFDYSAKYSEERVAYMSAMLIALLALLVVMLYFIYKSGIMSKKLKEIVASRTEELESRTGVLTSTMKALEFYSEMLLMLHNTADTGEVMKMSAVKTKELFHCSRVTVIQKRGEGDFAVMEVFSDTPDEPGAGKGVEAGTTLTSVLKDARHYRKLYREKLLRLENEDFSFEDETAKVRYICWLDETKSFVILSFDDANRHLSDKEEKMMLDFIAIAANHISKTRVLATMETVLNASSSYVFVSSLENCDLLFANDRVKELYNLPDNYAGVSCRELFCGNGQACEGCRVHTLKDEFSPALVWEEDNLETKHYYLNRDQLIRWIDGSLVHIQHSSDITFLKETERTLNDTLKELATFNELLMILQNVLDVDEGIRLLAVNLLHVYACRNIAVIQKLDKSDVGPVYEVVAAYPKKPEGCILERVSGLALSPALGPVPMEECDPETAAQEESLYVMALGKDAGYMVLSYEGKGTFLNEKERKMIIGTAVLFESLIVRKKAEYERAHFAEYLEQKVAERTLELKIMTARAEEARITAERAAASKSIFLAHMSHEIRTPMNAVAGMAELILHENIPHDVYENVLSIKHASSNLLSIINDILDFSKIEAGKIEIIEAEYLFSSFINDVMSIIYVRLFEKPVQFAVSIDPDIPNKLIGDETRMRQVLLNILSNAVKYTYEGSIALRITGELMDGEAELRFAVSDTGIGIREESLDKLFMDFVQLDTVKNKNIQGTGLGLAISKKLCQEMNGDILVESEYGVGSTFTVVVRQKVGEYEPFAAVAEAESKSVLLLEPRKVYMEAIQEALQKLGVRCAAAVSLQEYYAALGSGQYTYVFVASFMYETACRVLDELKQKSKVILLADYGDIQSHQATSIPMPANALSIANALNDVTTTKARFIENRELYVRFIAPEARVLVVDDIYTNLKVAKGFISLYKMQIDVCKSAIEALYNMKFTKYDIVFMDHMMPEMDGIEATKRIRAMEDGTGYYSEVPIVALTANALSGVKEMFLANGFNDFLAKPIETAKLAAIMEKWIPREKRESYKEEGPAADKPELTIPGIDVETGVLQTGGTTDMYLKTLAVYYEDVKVKINELLKSLEEDNIPLFTNHAHALKGASANIGAKDAAENARLLEVAGKASDRVYINSHAKVFVAELEELLRHIDAALPKQSAEVKTGKGDPVFLKEKLARLCEAFEIMDINQIDGVMDELSRKSWDEGVETSLSEISKSILLYEYDRAAEIVNGMCEDGE